jgi:hypothetical protein
MGIEHFSCADRDYLEISRALEPSMIALRSIEVVVEARLLATR